MGGGDVLAALNVKLLGCGANVLVCVCVGVCC